MLPLMMFAKKEQYFVLLFGIHRKYTYCQLAVESLINIYFVFFLFFHANLSNCKAQTVLVC